MMAMLPKLPLNTLTLGEVEIRDDHLAPLAAEVATLLDAVDRRRHLLDFFDDEPLSALCDPTPEAIA